MANSPEMGPATSWLSIVCITSLQATTGTRSIVSSYDSILKSRLRLSHVELNFLFVALDVGALFTWLPTKAADHLPMNMILLIGLIMEIFGYAVQYLYLIGRITNLSYWFILSLNVIAGNSMCWITTYCELVTSKTFKEDNPNTNTVKALTSSYGSLSAKIYTLLGKGIHGKGTSAYLLLSCLVPTLVSLAVAVLNNFPCLIQFGEADIFPTLFGAAIATGLYAFSDSIAPTFKYMGLKLRVAILILAIVLPFSATPALSSGFSKIRRWFSQIMPKVFNVEDKVEGDEEKGFPVENEEKQVEKIRERGENDEHGKRNLMASMNFWLYFCVNACGITLGTVYVSNLTHISQARGYHDVSFLVVLFSLSGFFSRIFLAAFGWYTREAHVISRTGLITLIMIPMPASFFLLTVDSNICLYITTAILGACSSAITDIGTSTDSDIFGHQNSTSHAVLLGNIPLGSLLFGHLAAAIIDQKPGNDLESRTGSDSHQKIIVIFGFISSLGTILSFILHRRTRKSFPSE